MNRPPLFTLSLAVVFGTFLSAGSTTANAQSAFWSGLHAGAHAVGFRIVDTADATRSFPSAEGRMESRPMRLYVWYPAIASTAARQVTWGEIVHETKPLHTPTIGAKAFDRMVFGLLNGDEINSADTVVANARIDSMSAIPMAARWNARATSDRFPVVLLTPGAPGPFMVAAELLASHGFVVIGSAQRNHSTLESLDFTPNLANIDAEVEDLEFSLGAARAWRNTDAQRVGVMGFSTGSLSALAFAFKSRVPKAVVSLEGWEGTEAGVPIIRSYRYFDRAGFGAAYLLAGKAVDDAPPFQKTSAFLDSMRFTPRWRVTFDSATHGDFLGLSRASRRVFAQSNEYVLAFLRAQLGPARSANWLPSQQTPGIHAQTFTTLAAIPGREEFYRLAESNAAVAMTTLRELLQRDSSSAVPFTESSLNRLANLTREFRPADALIINEIVLLGFPRSARAAVRLSDAYWNAGRLDDARVAAQRALELIDRDEAVPEDQRESIRVRLRARVSPN